MCMNTTIYKKEDTTSCIHSERMDYTFLHSFLNLLWHNVHLLKKVPTILCAPIICITQKQTLHFSNADINLPYQGT